MNFLHQKFFLPENPCQKSRQYYPEIWSGLKSGYRISRILKKIWGSHPLKLKIDSYVNQIKYFSRILRRNYDLLLGAIVLADVANESGAFYMMFSVYAEKQITMFDCLFAQAVPICGVIYGYLIIFAISIDRFLAAIFPIL